MNILLAFFLLIEIYRKICDNILPYSNIPLMLLDLRSCYFQIHKDKEILKGPYTFKLTFYFFDDQDVVEETRVILGGTVYGLLGTDAFRRDLAIGILWGTPVALFIGLTVAIGYLIYSHDIRYYRRLQGRTGRRGHDANK